MDITIKPNISDRNFISGLQETMKIIDRIDNCQDDTVTVCFDERSFVTPLFVLPLLIYKNSSNKKIIFKSKSSYIDTIFFVQGGLKSNLPEMALFKRKINGYSQKTYIPIINFSAIESASEERNAVLTVVSDLLKNQLNLSTNVLIGVKYLIEENIDNIIEHSDSKCGYIFSQYYPQKKYLDLCIADNGITLLGSYKKMKDNNIFDHLTAMKAANSGISTKNLPEVENRGYGIATSKKMLIDGLSGNYIMLSGNVLYIKTGGSEEYISLPPFLNLGGTIVAMRIPYQNQSFNYINYVE